MSGFLFIDDQQISRNGFTKLYFIFGVWLCWNLMYITVVSGVTLPHDTHYEFHNQLQHTHQRGRMGFTLWRLILGEFFCAHKIKRNPFRIRSMQGLRCTNSPIKRNCNADLSYNSYNSKVLSECLAVMWLNKSLSSLLHDIPGYNTKSHKSWPMMTFCCRCNLDVWLRKDEENNHSKLICLPWSALISLSSSHDIHCYLWPTQTSDWIAH